MLLKFVVPSSGYGLFFRQEVLFIDSQTLIMQMPSAKDWVFKNNSRTVQIYLSLNDGVDWTTDNVTFQFYDDPQMTRLSQNQ